MSLIEQRRALVRATQTGMSVIVDPIGRVVALLPAWRATSLVHEVPLLRGRTLYAALGDWPALLGAFVGLGLLVGRRTPRVTSLRGRTGTAAT